MTVFLREGPRVRAGLPFTLRRWRVPLAIWALATGAGALAGPFGTFEALTLPARALYWGGIAAVAVALSLALQALHRGALGGGLGAGLALDVGYALLLAGLVHALNRALFPDWVGWDRYLWLVAVILAVTLGVAVLHWLFAAGRRPMQDAGAQGPPPGDTAPLLERLPLDKRGTLLRIEAQDHYLLVVTSRGREMLLMRMADAEALLGAAGLRVHRSHWVARDAVARVTRDGGRWRLVLRDGSEVPVSRGYRGAVAAAGLIPAG